YQNSVLTSVFLLSDVSPNSPIKNLHPWGNKNHPSALAITTISEAYWNAPPIQILFTILPKFPFSLSLQLTRGLMELKTPSESEAVSLSDCASDPEEQEFSDDDRNHKHRKRDTRSQSSERDQTEQFVSRPYRKHGKAFDNGHPSRESDPQSRYNMDREFSSKFGRRPLNVNQKFKTNQSFSGDFGSGRGRGRNSGFWNQRDSRFTPIDIASQMAPLGPHPSAVFSGMGLHNVPNAQSSPWAGGFGLIPGIPNGAIDPILPLGLQGTFRPPLNPSLNMGIPRQRCRDFEERGFCLRGDMCLMEHGVNRIVVEDVQSLSQFNLPASLPGGHALGNPGGSGLTVGASSSALMSNKVPSNRASKPGIDDGSYTLGGDGIAADVYDPDQPLWNSDFPHTSTAILAMQTPTIGEIESYMEADPSDPLVSGNGASTGPQSTSSSIWRRVNSVKNRFESGGRTDSRVNSSKFPDGRNKEKGESYSSLEGPSHHGKRNNAGELVNPSSRVHNDYGRSMRKPFQKALRTLFVSNIPLKDNKKEALYCHFKKFGEIIDIHIPPNSELAFVQFSKKEEAERALKSPDAVMGNRFIKLLWANRDNIVEDNIVGGKTIPRMQHHMEEAPNPLHMTNANASKENIQLGISKPKPPATNGSKVLAEPPVKKKENLELLKEELRKKQEMLERKRNEFRLQLDKLQKHAAGPKDDVPEVQAAKKLKVEGADDAPKQLNLGASGSDLRAEGSMHRSQQVENVTPHSIKTKFSSPMLDSSNLKHGAHPLNYVGSPFPTNRYKLDNRPTSFRVNAPLPPEFANVNALREHFAVFGDVSNIELENSEAQDENRSESNLSACIHFKARHAAEKAFINGKSWNNHGLQLTWLIPGKPNSIPKDKSPASRKPSPTELHSLQNPQDSSGEKGSSLSAPKDASGTEIQSVEKSACDISQDSCGDSQTSGHDLASFSGAEAQSADKSAAGSSKEASLILEGAEKEGEMELDEPNEDPAASGEKQHAEEDVC
ncbi:hypothetical protein V2J09_005536, partial [Rumex salicifolius]